MEEGCSCGALRWPTRQCPGLQGLDADHPPAVAVRALPQRHAGEPLIPIPIVGGFIGRQRSGHIEQLTTAFQLDRAAAVGEPAVVADALESGGQDVQQEAPHEFPRLDPHHLLAGRMAIVLPAERDLAVGERDEPAVGDGHPMRVAPEVLEHALRPTERRFGVDDPLGLGRRREIPGERARVCQLGQGIVERERTRREGLLQHRQEPPAEQA